MLWVSERQRGGSVAKSSGLVDNQFDAGSE